MTSVAHRIEKLRRIAGAKFVERSLEGLAQLGSLHPRARPERHGVRVHRDIPYQHPLRAEHTLDVYLPETPPPPEGRPVVLYLHGGGFRILSKNTHWLMGLAFARRGFVVFNANYRLAPKHKYPAAPEDASAALQWVLRRARDWGGDPSRIVIAGESAGANLSVVLAAACTYERPEPWARAVYEQNVVPKAVLPACGLFQVSQWERFHERKPQLSRFLRDRIRDVHDAYLVGADTNVPGGTELADPLLLFEKGPAPNRPLPPFFLPCGTSDPILDDTRRLARAVRSLGATAEERYYPGELHAFHAFVWRPHARECWREMLSFAEQHSKPSSL